MFDYLLFLTPIHSVTGWDFKDQEKKNQAQEKEAEG